MAARRANRGKASLFGDDERPTLVAFPEPTGEASSLHDLFGGGSDEAAAGALTFTRPQQPLASGRPAATETAAASGSTIYAQLVQVFRDVGGAWQPVGQSGLALMGSPAPATHPAPGGWWSHTHRRMAESAARPLPWDGLIHSCPCRGAVQ